MQWSWTVALGLCGWVPQLLLDAPDAAGLGGGADPAGTGGGSPPPSGSADVETSGAEGDPGGEPAREEALEDLLLDDDEDQDTQRPVEERLKALTGKNRKLRKQVAKKIAALKRVEGMDLDDLVARARNHDRMAEAIARLSPRQRAVLYGGDAEPETPARPAAREAAPETFDPKSLPFDVNESEINRYFGTLAEENFTLRQQYARLNARVEQIDGRDASRTEAQEKSSWKGAIDAAAEKIDSPHVRKMFKDAMAGAYRDRARHGRGAQDLIAHYLKDSNLTPQEKKEATAAAKAATPPAARPTAATQQRIAEANKHLPKTVAPSGTPAPARSDKPSLADIRKSLGGGRR